MSQVSTYQIRLPRGPHEAVLDRMAGHLSNVERHLHRALEKIAHAVSAGAKEKDLRNALKSRFILEHGITARHYNSLLASVEGRQDSLRELTKLRIETMAHKIGSLQEKVRKHEKKVRDYRKAVADAELRRRSGKKLTKSIAEKLDRKDEARKSAFALHHQKRKIQSLRDRIKAAEADLARPVPRIVFGSAALLRKRAEIHPNDKEGLAAWKRKWQEARGAQFLLVGSKDETSGCQSCVARLAADGTIGLTLRLPDAIAEGNRRLSIAGITLPGFGGEQIRAALLAHARKDASGRVAMTWRLVRDPDWRDSGRLSAWRAMVTLSVPTPEIERPSFITPFGRNRELEARGRADVFAGAIGVDLNADHLAWARIDRDGNPLRGQCGRIELPLRGKTSDQRLAIIGDAATEIVRIAGEIGLPLVMESLDFSKKKKDMADRGSARQNRMLSSLSYARIQVMIRRSAVRAGVELVEVNPAWTSMIGRTNFSRRYGLSVHLAAAVAIARRAACFSERINYVHGFRGRRNTLPTQSECRRHVWRQWGLLRKEEAAAKRKDKGRPTAGAVSSTQPYRDLSREGSGERLRKQRTRAFRASS